MHPKARSYKLLVHDVGGEVIIYDQHRETAHRLNPTAAFVWRHCDGSTSVETLTTLLAQEFGVPEDPNLVHLALNRLDQAELIKEPVALPAGVSRRRMVQRLAAAAASVALVPVVSSLVAPTPAMAQSAPSGGGNGDVSCEDLSPALRAGQCETVPCRTGGPCVGIPAGEVYACQCA